MLGTYASLAARQLGEVQTIEPRSENGGTDPNGTDDYQRKGIREAVLLGIQVGDMLVQGVFDDKIPKRCRLR
jgi:hypothetical protein